MLSGRRLDLLDPSPLDIEIEDIAHGLARVARWNGQTAGAHIYSVAQHSLLVEALAREKIPRLDRGRRLAVLLHRARGETNLSGMRLGAGERSLRLRFTRGWLRKQPLTQADLEQEAVWLRAAGLRLEFS